MIQLYAHPASQPSRAVIWACVIEQLPIVLNADPTVEGVSLRGQIPVLQDDDFQLTEMSAILSYLATKYEWLSLYPQELQTQARISQYLHLHHSLTRLATTKLMAPHVLVVFGGVPTANPLSHINNTMIQAAMDDPDNLRHSQDLLHQLVEFIEKAYLQDQDFIAGTRQATIADIACYEELGQLPWANLLDLSAHPAVYRWTQRMCDLPEHDAVHLYNTTLGDVCRTPNTMERFSQAIVAGMSALEAIDCITLST